MKRVHIAACARGAAVLRTLTCIPLHSLGRVGGTEATPGRDIPISVQERTLRVSQGRLDRQVLHCHAFVHMGSLTLRVSYMSRGVGKSGLLREVFLPLHSGGTLEKDARKLAHCLAAIFGNPDGVAQHVEFAALVEAKVDQEGHVGENFGVVVRS